MIDMTDATSIETVMVTIGDEILDCVSFATRATAEAYKRGVRNWALENAVIVRVHSQSMDILPKTSARCAPEFALAS